MQNKDTSYDFKYDRQKSKALKRVLSLLTFLYEEHTIF